MKAAAVGGLLLLCTILAAVPVVDRHAVADSVAALAISLLPADRGVCLEIAADEWTADLTDCLKTRLLRAGVPLSANGGLQDITLQIGCNSSKMPTRGIFDFSTPQTRYLFTLQTVDNTSGQIIAWRTYETFAAFHDQESEHLRWYDPVLATTVVGGLIYLFYFGAK